MKVPQRAHHARRIARRARLLQATKLCKLCIGLLTVEESPKIGPGDVFDDELML